MAAAEVRWLDIDRSTRRRVARSARAGAAVSAPGDAAVAVGYCAATLEWLWQRERLRPFELAVVVILLADLVITRTWPVSPMLGGALGFAFLRLRTPRLQRRLAAALDANVSVAADWSLTPVRVRLPGHAWLRPGSRRRRLMRVLKAALAVLAAAFLFAGFLPRENGRWAAKANRICAREEARLAELHARRLDPSETLQRRIVIERDTLVALGRIRRRTSLESRLLAWRRSEVELDAWLAAAASNTRVPELAHRAQARKQARALARRLGAETCARL